MLNRAIKGLVLANLPFHEGSFLAIHGAIDISFVVSDEYFIYYLSNISQKGSVCFFLGGLDCDHYRTFLVFLV